MIKQKISRTGLLILYALISFSIYSQDLKDKRLEIYISGGALLSGKVQGSYEADYNPDSTVTIKNKVSPLIRLVADYQLTPKLSVGINMNYAKFNIKDILYKGESMKTGNEVSLGVWDGREHIIPLDDIKMLELNTSIKWRFFLNEKMVLKPCLYLGYRKTFSGSPDAREKGMVLNYNVEYQYYIKAKYFIMADFGIISQPYGGVSHVAHVRSFGVPYFSVGYGISL
ncbi:MAG: hypothetical protein P1P88_24730 [Bacteroidales bacterium]|nr:hypothetical protein [Bacteroidales bacterium]